MTGLGTVASVGAEQLGSAALTVLGYLAMTIGAIVMLCTVLLAVLLLWPVRRKPGSHAATQPSAVIPEVTACPWCDTRECLDSTLCTCEVPCGSWLCTACPCCTGDSGDCTCRDGCGAARCQAYDPEAG